MSTQDSYHDTVSKMARKYSQYRLPDTSELVESDDPNNDNVATLLPTTSINSLSELPTNSSDRSNSSNNNIPLEHDDDEEDEDLYSETNTMISHKSYSSKPFLLRKQSSTNSVNMRPRKTSKIKFGTITTTHYNPIEEIREIQTDKALFISIFDKYFDESKEGDVDFSEFKKGLIKLGHTGSDEHITKLFNILLMNGDDTENNDGYLQSDQFSDFLTRKFENPQLIAFQELLLNIIIPNTKKNDDRHRLINADDAEQWDAAEVSLAEAEMRQAMEQMVDSEMEKIKQSNEFCEELSRRIADPEFGTDLNAENWDYYEVAYWVQKNGYDYCMKRFYDQKIDGNVFLYDININMLINTLGVNTLHAKKFMRNLSELKSKIMATKTVLSIEENMFDIHIESKSSEHKEVNNEVNKLKTEVNELESEKNKLDNENKLLNSKILNFQNELNESQSKYLNIKEEMISLNNKLIDYKSMKSSYDSICKQFNDTKLEYQNMKNKYESRIELINKQFNDNINNLKNQIKKLTKMNNSLSDENVQLKNKAQSVSVSQSVDDEKNKDFARAENSDEWNMEEVGYWLSTIGMKKYSQSFMDQDIDGQILLHDINKNNLINDLLVKSIHAPKIIREINKLKQKSGLFDTFEEDILTERAIVESVIEIDVPSTENELMNKLKTDLEDARKRLNALKFQMTDTKSVNKMNMTIPQSILSQTLPQLSPQNSVISVTSHQSDATSNNGMLYPVSEHNRNESVSTQQTTYSEGDFNSKGKTVQELKKYIKYLETKITDLETTNRELSTLFYRADKNLKEYTTAIVPFQQRIRSLEAQNEKRKETIDKLNKRIGRRNQTIERFKQQQLQRSLTKTYGHNIPNHIHNNIPNTIPNTIPNNMPMASVPMTNVSNRTISPRKKKIKKGIILTHNYHHAHRHIPHQPAHNYAPSTMSANSANSDASLIGSIYGYIMGSTTPGN